jgi:hypothetical protein
LPEFGQVTEKGRGLVGVDGLLLEGGREGVYRLSREGIFTA